MKVKDIIKKQTTIIAIAVVLVAMAAMGVSYAIFFDIHASGDQVITAGTLKVTITGASSLDSLEVIGDTAGLGLENPMGYTIKNSDANGNNSNLPNKYKIYIYADNSNSIDVSKLKLAISDDSNSATEAKAFVNTDTYSITNKEDSACTTDCTAYKIDEGTLAAGDSTKTKYIRVWVDENQVTDELNDTAVSLKLFVVSEVDETQATS